MRNGYIWIRLSGIVFLLGVAAFYGKMHEFSWGDVEIPVLPSSPTVNDVWYYALDDLSNVLFSCSISYMATCLLEQFPNSFWVWMVKYASIIMTFVLAARAIAHYITYTKVTIYEYIAYGLLALYPIYRAILWAKTHPLYVKRSTMAHN